MVAQEEMGVIVVVIVNHVTKTSTGVVVDAIANGMMAVAMVIDPNDKIMTINEVKYFMNQYSQADFNFRWSQQLPRLQQLWSRQWRS